MSNKCMEFPGNLRRALTLSYDDGVEQDIRLIDIMNRHGLKGTFNLNSGLYAAEGTVYPKGHVHRRLSRSQVTEVYGQSGQEVAIHCYTHADLAQQSPENVAWEVMKDKETLEEQFGRIIRGMAYPFGTTNDAVAETLRRCGVAYARTTVSTERFDIPTNWLQMPATCHHRNPRLMELARDFVERDTRWRPQLFYLWGHSYEFEDNDNWHVIEEFADFMGGRDNIWYATNIEIHDYVEAYRHLQTSADGKRVYNPTAIAVFFSCDGQHYAVQPGQEICL